MNTIFDGYLTGEEMALRADDAWAKCAVASFTRAYDNSLMWSHYADSHRGAVIAIDADLADLTSRQLLIPVQFGAVIYMKRPNRAPYGRHTATVKLGEDRFDIENYERLQRLFLSKPISWAYEEEIRAVCEPQHIYWNEDGTNWTGNWAKIPLADKTIYGLKLPRGAITQIFCGLRFEPIEWLREQAIELGFTIQRAIPDHDRYDLQFEPDGG